MAYGNNGRRIFGRDIILSILWGEVGWEILRKEVSAKPVKLM